MTGPQTEYTAHDLARLRDRARLLADSISACEEYLSRKTHVHGHGCPRDVEGPSVMWLCGNEPRSTPKPGTGPQFVYPEQRDDETGAQYWARVRAMGLPYEWERDKAVPPGPITVTHEWSLRDPYSSQGAMVDLAFTTDECEANMMADQRPDYQLVRRTRWTAVGEWEDAPDA